MEFVLGCIGAMTVLTLASWLGTGEVKVAKSYQELMKRPAFNQDDIDEV